MKKIIISSCILLFCIATISAQRNYKREFAVGAKFGTTFSRVTLRPSVRQNYEMGYMEDIRTTDPKKNTSVLLSN